MSDYNKILKEIIMSLNMRRDIALVKQNRIQKHQQSGNNDNEWIQETLLRQNDLTIESREQRRVKCLCKICVWADGVREGGEGMKALIVGTGEGWEK